MIRTEHSNSPVPDLKIQNVQRFQTFQATYSLDSVVRCANSLKLIAACQRFQALGRKSEK